MLITIAVAFAIGVAIGPPGAAASQGDPPADAQMATEMPAHLRAYLLAEGRIFQDQLDATLREYREARRLDWLRRAHSRITYSAIGGGYRVTTYKDRTVLEFSSKKVRDQLGAEWLLKIRSMSDRLEVLGRGVPELPSLRPESMRVGEIGTLDIPERLTIFQRLSENECLIEWKRSGLDDRVLFKLVGFDFSSLVDGDPVRPGSAPIIVERTTTYAAAIGSNTVLLLRAVSFAKIPADRKRVLQDRGAIVNERMEQIRASLAREYAEIDAEWKEK